MKSGFNIFFAGLCILFFFDCDGYEVLEKTTTSPGCNGGTLYSKTESGYFTSITELKALHPEIDISIDNDEVGNGDAD